MNREIVTRRTEKNRELAELLRLPLVSEVARMASEQGIEVSAGPGDGVQPVWSPVTGVAYTVVIGRTDDKGIFMVLAHRRLDGEIELEIISNFALIARYLPLYSMPESMILSYALGNPERDEGGLLVPEKYLAGLPKKLRAQRIKELTESRRGQRGYEELPTDIAARKLGITKKGRYTAEAERRGIEFRGDYADMAVRALLYYGLDDDTRTVRQLAGELQKINKKGMAAWQTGGHRPGASQRAWGYARMASFLVGGKTTWTADNKNFRSLPKAFQKAVEAERVWTRD